MEIIDRFFQPPKTSFFLFGPRGTGKSTFVHQSFKDAVYIDLLDPERIRFFSAMPERLREIVDASPRSGCLVIDEIQRVPELLTVVHSLIEAKKGWKFILHGLRSFREEYPKGKTFLLYRGKDRFVMDGILCAPCKDFLMGLRPDRTLDGILT